MRLKKWAQGDVRTQGYNSLTYMKPRLNRGLLLCSEPFTKFSVGGVGGGGRLIDNKRSVHLPKPGLDGCLKSLSTHQRAKKSIHFFR